MESTLSQIIGFVFLLSLPPALHPTCCCLRRQQVSLLWCWSFQPPIGGLTGDLDLKIQEDLGYTEAHIPPACTLCYTCPCPGC